MLVGQGRSLRIDLRVSRGTAWGEAARWGVRVGWRRFRMGAEGKGAVGYGWRGSGGPTLLGESEQASSRMCTAYTPK